MKNIKWIFTSLILFLAFSGFSQDQRTFETKVADILTEMPAESASHRDKLMERILVLDSKGIAAFVALLTPPGEDDDTRVRYALESLAKYVTKKGHEPQRNKYSKVLTTELNKSLDEEIKVFLIRRLQFTAQNSEIPALKSFIGDAYLAEATIRTLITIGTPEAEKALLESLNQVSGAQQVAVVKALGQLRSKAATEMIMKLATTDTDLKKVSLFALANTADPKAYSIMMGAAKQASFQYEPTQATDALLTYGENLLAQGQQKLSNKIAKTLVKKCKTQRQSGAKARALSLLVAGKEQTAPKILLKEIKNKEMAYRNKVLSLANAIPGAATTSLWVAKTQKSPPQIQTEIITMLGERGDKSALEPLQSYLHSSNDLVKVAALKSVTKLDKENAIDVALTFLKKNDGLANEGKRVLTNLVGFNDLGKLVAALEQMPENGKQALIEIIAARKGTPHFDVIYQYALDQESTVGKSALLALKDISSANSVRPLLSLLNKVKAKEDVKNIQDALVIAINDTEDDQKRQQKTLAILSNAVDKGPILNITPQIGGELVLKKVVDEFKNGNAKDAAFEALANWRGANVAPELFKILSAPTSGMYQGQAFRGYIQAASAKNIPDDQKLLMLRKAMPFAKTVAEKKNIIRSLSNVRTFLSFIYVSQFLDDNDLQQSAASAAMNIALPKPGEKQGLYGKNIEQALKKVIEVLKGPDSQYFKIDIQTYLEQMPEGKGYVPMFNGKDLTGWKGFVADPIKISAMSKDVLAQKQTEANKTVTDSWGVKDGSIVFNGKGHNLVSVKEYGDFEMILDWRITKDGDSGIYLRGTPQVQIWDTSRVESGAHVGSGGLYNNQKNERIPLVLADNAIGDWNTFYIKMIGEQVTVYLNGQLVVDNVTMENYWDRKQPIFPTGPIELQAHGTDLAFRDIYVREISSPDFSLTPDEKSSGFQSLFNGKNLDAWLGNKISYQVENGNIVIDPKGGGGGNLFTKKEYSDFIYRFEFQLTPGANNGLGIHAPLKGDAAYVGKELQILDNTASIYANLKDYQYHGSVYGIIPAKRGFLKPVGEWNTEEVMIKGSKIKIILNGTTIVDGDFIEASKNGTLDGKEHPGLQRTKGHIGFLGHGSVVKFRNIRIKDLSR
ncbi:MAG: DUF1080 domain-containing protein [Bacteroidetes bacterium]|nr:DUF1080 domain-containing protein [Bacteroidota bacterium]